MKALKQMSLDLRNKIRHYAKNGIDVSNIIEGYSLKGEDLSHCIIKNLQRIDEDLTGVNFAHAKIGNLNNQTIYFLRCKINDSNFDSITFIGKIWMRNCEVRNCNFRNGNLASVDYRNSDFRNSVFCDTIMKIGTAEGIGCIFSEGFFEALLPGWKVKVEVISKGEINSK
jgi:uncharacterized protein YjbI with pentapeptide repeats